MHATCTIGAVFNSRWRENHYPLIQLHNESSIEEELDNKFRAVDILYNHVIENIFSRALIIKICGGEVRLICLFQSTLELCEESFPPGSCIS